MDALRILVLCISAAMICTALRTTHPQIASAVALAACVAALMASVQSLGAFSAAVRNLDEQYSNSGLPQPYLLKICGLALISELASDICRDSGETALAHRIQAGTKLGIAAAALPLAGEILETIKGMLA